MAINPSTVPATVAALYQFRAVADPAALRDDLFAFCDLNGIHGTLLIAAEGINGTVAGSAAAIGDLRQRLEVAGFDDLEWKLSSAAGAPFHRLKVKVKPEIVTMGIEGVDPNRRSGTRVSPRQWDALLEDPDVLVIDTRNDYEVEIGTFEGAVSPGTENFRQFPDYVDRELDPARHRKVAMFCTGGIRCEKASAYMLEKGFEEVYHLGGGILRYLEQTPAPESAFKGECFVFDNRVSVDVELGQGGHTLCYGCRRPVSAADRESPRYEEGVSCPRCFDSIGEDRKRGFRERHRQEKLAERRGRRHVGARMNEAGPES